MLARGLDIVQDTDHGFQHLVASGLDVAGDGFLGAANEVRIFLVQVVQVCVGTGEFLFRLRHLVESLGQLTVFQLLFEVRHIDLARFLALSACRGRGRTCSCALLSVGLGVARGGRLRADHRFLGVVGSVCGLGAHLSSSSTTSASMTSSSEEEEDCEAPASAAA